VQLSETLTHRSFAEWNYLVRGLMVLWEIANRLEIEDRLEEMLAGDCDGALSELLGLVGNACRPAQSLSPDEALALVRLPVQFAASAASLS